MFFGKHSDTNAWKRRVRQRMQRKNVSLIRLTMAAGMGEAMDWIEVHLDLGEK